MASLSTSSGYHYARRLMPQAKTEDGPWGAAIMYWLPKRDMRKIDLARATGIEPKTISRIARGFPTTTNVLRKIADALKVPLEDALVSPARRSATADRRQLVNEVVNAAIIQLDELMPPAPAPLEPPPSDSTRAGKDELRRAVREREENARKAKKKSGAKKRRRGGK